MGESRLRLTFLGVLVLGLFLALGARLWYLQVVAEEEFVVQARANLERTVQIPATRGRILDVNGRVLVGNRVTNLVSVDKFVLYQEAPTASERSEIALRLAREISKTGRLIKAEAIESAFNDSKYGNFDNIPVAADVTEEFAILLGERLEDFPGVEVMPATVREYPFASVGVHLLGTIGPIVQSELNQLENHPKSYVPNDTIGKTGIERSFEDILRGQPGQRVLEVDAFNRVVSVLEETDPVPGQDVQLTIDIDIQRMVEFELSDGIAEARKGFVRNIQDEKDGIFSEELHRATGGAVVLLDPDGSRVIAMASYPTFDPQPFVTGISQEAYDLLNDKAAFAPLFNRATSARYSPGSTFKPFTTYAAMDSGMLGDRGFLGLTEFTEDGGFFRIPNCDTQDCRFQNAGGIPYGDVDMVKAIAVSSDVYYYQLAYQFDVRAGFDSNSIQTAANLFGFGRATGIQLPANEDEPGTMPSAATKSGWTAGDTIILSIGQGDVAATPLQMANAYAVLANGGTLYSPQLVDRIIDQVSDETVNEFGQRVVDELYMPDWMRDPIIDGLAQVVTYDDPESENDGTARKLFEDFPNSRWPVAAKTGTIEKDGKQDSSAFAAFAPVSDPEYVAFAYVEEGGFGAAAAGPIVRNIFAKLESGDIERAPTAAEIEDYWRTTLFGELENEDLVPTGDLLTDVTSGLASLIDAGPEPEVLIDPDDLLDADDPDVGSADADGVDSGSVDASNGADPDIPPALATLVPTATPPVVAVLTPTPEAATAVPAAAPEPTTSPDPTLTPTTAPVATPTPVAQPTIEVLRPTARPGVTAAPGPTLIPTSTAVSESGDG